MTTAISIRVLETAGELAALEDLQRAIWPGSETEIVPVHMLRAAVSGGGLALGAFSSEQPAGGNFPASLDGRFLVGFVFGFPGFYATPDGPRLKHCSHMMGVLPGSRDQGIGFLLKRAQWQLARQQGVDRITWTYDPLLSRNAYLNIARLGAVCNTYHVNYYGELPDTLNAGLATDRFEVDWWVNSRRVNQRLSKTPRPALAWADFAAAETRVIHLLETQSPEALGETLSGDERMILAAIPRHFQEMRSQEPDAAARWRQQSRMVFQTLFSHGYLLTDFLPAPDNQSLSYYVLTFDKSTF